MALDIPALVRGTVEKVERIAGSVRTTVSHQAVTGRNAFGPVYGTPVDRLVMVEQVAETVASADGTVRVSAATYTFFEPVVIDEGDRLTLNGRVATVIKVAGLVDPATGRPYQPVAFTGKP